jgi:murein DD-endopeptidase MepM/ murein hydrolase activator NlpD
MTQITKIKKVERKIFIYYLNFYNSIKKVITSFFKFLLNIGNQKVTIMFIPHSEKKVFNIKVNLFILFTVILISSVTLSLILGFGIMTKSTHDKWVEADKGKQFSEKRVKDYQEMINEIIENHSVFKTKLDVLLSQLNSSIIKNMQEGNMLSQGGPVNQVDSTNIDDFDMEKMDVKNLLSDYQYSIQAFAELNKMANNYNKLMTDLPFGSPVVGPYVYTSGFGIRIHPITKVLDMHTGVDLAWGAGTLIVATAPGIVEKVEWNPEGYGWFCTISHKLGFSTLYGHMRSQPVVSPGEKVRKGQLLGYMGRTGSATGVHTHYEIRLGDNLLDPWRFVVTY